VALTQSNKTTVFR